MDQDKHTDDDPSLDNWDNPKETTSMDDNAGQLHWQDNNNVSTMKVDVQYADGEEQNVSLGLGIDVLGEIEMVQREIEKEEINKYKVVLECDQPLSLDEFVDIFRIDSGVSEESENLSIDFGNSESINATVQRRTAKMDHKKKNIDREQHQSSSRKSHKIPNPPDVDFIEGKENTRFYNRLLKGENDQPNTIRRLMYELEETTKQKLDEKIENEGYSKSSSGVATTLRVLEKIGEIERRGSGDTQKIFWTGTRNNRNTP